MSQANSRLGGSATRWRVAPRIDGREQELLGTDSLLTAQLLWNRSIRTATEAGAFLAPPSMSSFGDPFRMLGMAAAVERLSHAIQDGTPVAIYGDYDVDGMAGAALLTECLESLGASVLVYVPHRERDGYGLNEGAVRSLASKGAGVVVTVDCGITADREVEVAAELGMDVVVTDHHTVPARLPSAAAVLNPHQEQCDYPCKDLAGGGVAFQLARALLSRFLAGDEADARALMLTDLAALSTVADVVPLIGENRSLVALGLGLMRSGARTGLRALSEVAKRNLSSLSARDLGFSLIPRLNAAGRMGEAQGALDLLLTQDEEEARILAAQLDSTNGERRRVMQELAEGMVAEAAEFAGASAIVLDGPYPIGLAGLLAARLADRWRVPSVVIQRGETISRGSARGPEGFDLMSILNGASTSLLQYGGHPRAAGFALKSEDIGQFRSAFERAAQTQQPAITKERSQTVDAVLRLRSIGPALADLVERFEPSGEGNPPPTFVSRGVIVSQQVVGEGPVRLRVADGEATQRAIIFRPDQVPPNGTRLDLYYQVRRNLWQGDQQIDLVTEDDGLVSVGQDGDSAI
ncbi:MAG: single-stranded-DNA-specific exonuclease RecJ [Chloroflexi bacterium]|nr:single-stranded-DNA-specific exonuclease RecJ [Chloroflexota bacterium]